MDVLDKGMDKLTINVSSLTIHYYVLKRNGYNRNFFIEMLILVRTNPFSALLSIYD